MRQIYQYKIDSFTDIFEKILFFLEKYETFCVLNSNSYNDILNVRGGPSYNILIGVGKISEFELTENTQLSDLENFIQNEKDWYFGSLSYDLKNRLEKLSSKNPDNIQFPLLYFFQPEIIIKLYKHQIEFHCKKNITKNDIEQIFNQIIKTSKPTDTNYSVKVESRTTKADYIKNVEKIISHIKLGDIYEMNYCINFLAKDADINPYLVYNELTKYSPSPFSCFYKKNDKYLVSASIERFIKKFENTLYTQPIKGTIKRGKTETEDKYLAEKLRNDIKERAENIMITDLVRNDLSRISTRGSVEVNELCGIYTYKYVHQMISTISCKLKQNITFAEILKAMFPMGSMTGAPKIRAMELIDKYENFSRGLYSGSIGYIDPDFNFDFNVIIRSILFNSSQKSISLSAGSAITSISDAEKEYDECCLKASALINLLSLNKLKK